MIRDIANAISSLSEAQARLFYAGCCERGRVLYYGWFGENCRPDIYGQLLQACWDEVEPASLGDLISAARGALPDEPDGFFDTSALGIMAALVGAAWLGGGVRDVSGPYDNVIGAWQPFLYWELGDAKAASDFGWVARTFHRLIES